MVVILVMVQFFSPYIMQMYIIFNYFSFFPIKSKKYYFGHATSSPPCTTTVLSSKLLSFSSSVSNSRFFNTRWVPLINSAWNGMHMHTSCRQTGIFRIQKGKIVTNPPRQTLPLINLDFIYILFNIHIGLFLLYVWWPWKRPVGFSLWSSNTWDETVCHTVCHWCIF